MTVDKAFMSLTVNTITAKLTNHVKRIRLELHHRLTTIFLLTLKMTSFEVVKTSVACSRLSDARGRATVSERKKENEGGKRQSQHTVLFQNCSHPDDHTLRSKDLFTVSLR